MESQTMCDTDFALDCKNALAAAPAFADGDVDADAFKNALEAVMGQQYAEQVGPIQDALDAAKDADNPVAINAQEAALDAAKDKLGEMYPKGYARLNKALEGIENGTMTFQKVAFDPERDNDGDVDYEVHDLSEGDDVVVMVSTKNDGEDESRYVLIPTKNGHSLGTCPDKVHNDGFPVCKHEMAWILYQVTSPFLSGTDTAVDEAAAKVESSDEVDDEAAILA